MLKLYISTLLNWALGQSEYIPLSKCNIQSQHRQWLTTEAYMDNHN